MFRKFILTFALLALGASPALAQDVVWGDQKPADGKTEVLSEPVDKMELHDWAGAACGGDCGQAPCDCQQHGGFFAGAGIYFIKPYWEENPAFLLERDNGGVFTTRTVDFDWDLEVSPYVYAGYMFDNSFGVRARYWEFDYDSSLEFTAPADVLNITDGAAFTVGGGGGDFIAARHELDFYLIDIEALKVWCVGNVELEASGGLRYLEMKQSYAFANVTTGAGVTSSNEFEGIGPTFAFRGAYRFGGSGLSFFASARLSVLFGDEDREASGIDAIGPAAFVGDSDGVLSIGEIEVGTRYETKLGNVVPFLEVAGVGQMWWGAESGVVSPIGASPTHNNNMGLAGFRVTAGIDF